MIRTPLTELLDRVAGGYKPGAADYEALPLRPGAASEVQQAVAKTTSSVAILRQVARYSDARRLCRVTAGDLARHLLVPNPAGPDQQKKEHPLPPDQYADVDAGARREDGVRALLDALTGPPTDPAAIAAEDRNAFTAAFAEATRRRNTEAAAAFQQAMDQHPASQPRPHLSGGTDPAALNDDDQLLRDLKRKLGITSSFNLDG